MTPSRLIVLGLLAALGLSVTAGCATETGEGEAKEAVGADESAYTLRTAHHLGTLEAGSSRAAAYMPPQRSAWSFTARGGDIVTITVSSQVGDAVAFLTDARWNLLALNDDAEPGTHDARIRYVVPTATPPSTFRIVFQDYQLLPAMFNTSLSVEASPSCMYGGSVHLSGEKFPAMDGCNTCSCGPDGVECTKRVCACNPDRQPDLHYIGTPKQCLTIHFSCPSGQVQFSNPCGCGCAALGATF